MALTRPRIQASLACGGALGLWWWRGGLLPAALAGVMAVLALLAWISPAAYAPVQRTLDRLLHGFLAGLTWLLLGLVWGLVFVPVRALRSLTGRDPLQRVADPAVTTYLRPMPPGAGRFDRQF